MGKKQPDVEGPAAPVTENPPGETEQPEIEKIPEDKPEIGRESSWSKDQQERSYYYDDSHGYEIYDPEKDDNDEEEE